MKLPALFATIAPYLEGKADHAAAVAALWPGVPGGGVEGDRLSLYGRFCALHRLEAVTLYRETAAAIGALAGRHGLDPDPAEAWPRLVDRFFAEHPMRHFEINVNSAALPAWLAARAAADPREGQGEDDAPAPPAWIAELADLEWCTWIAEYGADAPALPPDGLDVPRIAPSVDLRPYRHDLLGWLETDPRPASPALGDSLVLLWRDRDLDGRRDRVSAIELAVLKMASERQSLAELAAATGLAPEDIRGTVDDLREAGVLLD